MAEVERSVYFYKVEMSSGEWKRADVLRAISQLAGEDRVLELGDNNYAWCIVDQIPAGSGTGRLRFFRDRRSNLPGYAIGDRVSDLPIPDEAGLVEPTHIVLASDGLLAAEYNHFAPRIPTAFANLLRRRLGMNLNIGTFVQGDIVDQLDRLSYINLLEFSIDLNTELQAQIRNSGTIGAAAVELSEAQGGKRAFVRISGDKDSQGWTDRARAFVKGMLSLDGQHSAKVLRVNGLDPLTGEVEVVDLLKGKLVRKVSIDRPAARSKALDVSDAYKHVEEAIVEVKRNDLPKAGIVW